MEIDQTGSGAAAGGASGKTKEAGEGKRFTVKKVRFPHGPYL